MIDLQFKVVIFLLTFNRKNPLLLHVLPLCSFLIYLLCLPFTDSCPKTSEISNAKSVKCSELNPTSASPSHSKSVEEFTLQAKHRNTLSRACFVFLFCVTLKKGWIPQKRCAVFGFKWLIFYMYLPLSKIQLCTNNITLMLITLYSLKI